MKSNLYLSSTQDPNNITRIIYIKKLIIKKECRPGLEGPTMYMGSFSCVSIYIYIYIYIKEKKLFNPFGSITSKLLIFYVLYFFYLYYFLNNF